MKKAIYSMKLELVVIHDIDTMENLKGSHELAEDICHMICDEGTQVNADVIYNILETSLDTK